MSADEYAPFEANRNFFYLTGIRRENMMLILDNATEEPTETLLIEEADPDRERWMGKKMTVDEAKAQAQIEKVGFIDTEKSVLNRMLTREDVELENREQWDAVYELPALRDELMVFPAVVVLQLMAFYVSRDKGLDVDKPRNLAKSVTVE